MGCRSSFNEILWKAFNIGCWRPSCYCLNPVDDKFYGLLRHPDYQFRILIRLGLGRIRGRLLVEEADQIVIVHRQDLLDGLAALVEGGDVLLHGVP